MVVRFSLDWMILHGQICSKIFSFWEQESFGFSGTTTPPAFQIAKNLMRVEIEFSAKITIEVLGF